VCSVSKSYSSCLPCFFCNFLSSMPVGSFSISASAHSAPSRANLVYNQCSFTVGSSAATRSNPLRRSSARNDGRGFGHPGWGCLGKECKRVGLVCATSCGRFLRMRSRQQVLLNVIFVFPSASVSHLRSLVLCTHFARALSIPSHPFIVRTVSAFCFGRWVVR